MSDAIEAGLRATPSSTWALIDAVYAAGQSPDQWPELLDLLLTCLGENTPTSQSLLNRLHCHFEQALALNQHIAEQLSIEHVSEPALTSIGFPLVVVDARLNILYVSDSYSENVHRFESMQLIDGCLVFTDEAVRDTFEAVRTGDSAGVLLATESDDSFMVYALPIRPPNQTATHSARNIVLAWFDADAQRTTRCAQVATLYELTDAEARLLPDIVQGMRYADIAANWGVSENTVRTQVKQIFIKTDCHKRVELVQKILVGPDLLNKFSHANTDSYLDVAGSDDRHNQIVKLANGEQMGFAEFGPEDGEPIVLIHNIAGSRLQLPVHEQRLFDQHVRLILPDRPGIGLSGRPENFSMQGWADNLIELLDFLKLEQVPLLGTSMGGVYSLAAAAYHGDRFSRLVLASTMAEMPDEVDMDGLEQDMKSVLKLGKLAPKLTRYMLALMVRSGPASYIDRRLDKLPDADQAMYRNQPFYEMTLAALKENMRRGAKPMRDDLLLLAAPWEFAVENVNVPTQVWHGDLDITSPIAVVEKLVHRLPNAEMFVIPNETHMLIYRHWATIIACLRGESVARTVQATVFAAGG